MNMKRGIWDGPWILWLLDSIKLCGRNHRWSTIIDFFCSNGRWCHTLIFRIHLDIACFTKNWNTLARIQISSQKLISKSIWPSKAVVFTLVAKRDFATIHSQIDNWRRQSIVVIEQIRPHKYIIKRWEKSMTYFWREETVVVNNYL